LVFDRNYPPTINHAPQAEIVRRAATQALGPASAQAQEPTMGAEDFAYMLQATPGCYFFLGNGEGTHRLHGHGMGPCMLHNPSYDFNDALLPLAIKIWDEVVHIELPAAARETQQ
jgi:hippurate hydrolase